MTTNPSTSNLVAPDAALAVVGIDECVLTQLANEFFAAVPGGGSFLNATPAQPTDPLAAVDLPNEDDLRKIPAGLAGVSGQSPVTLAQNPTPSDAEAGFYFLKAVQTTSPGVLPLLRPDRPGFDPSLGSVPANVISTGRPLAAPNQADVPGAHHGSVPPHTPGIEIGSQPFAGMVPPASVFGTPGEEHLHALPGLLAGAVGLSPQSGATATGAALPGSPHYFLDGASAAPPRTPTEVDLRPRDASFDLLPDLGVPRTPGGGLNVPASLPGAPSLSGTPSKASESVPAPTPPVADTSGLSPYFLEASAFSGVTLPKEEPRPERVDSGASAHPGLDVHAVRRDFPILRETVHGQPLIWFDNAATTQRPQPVIDRIAYFYAHENSNIHRAAHELAARATDAYEGARDKVKTFLNAATPDEIIFVRGTTEGINLIAKSWGQRHIGKDDEIVLSHLEHHANIVPWQQLAAETGARLRVIPVNDDGEILLDEYERLLGPRTKLVSFTHVSNALGTVTPAREMIAMAHRYGAQVLVDGAQSVSHMPVDVQDLDADWLVFSGHKVFGPTGIGVVYGKLDILNATPPWQGGGNMIQDVTFERTIYQPPPSRFEAGTGNIADAVGLGAAIDYVTRIGLENIGRYEHELVEYATAGLKSVPGLRLVGTAKHKASVVSFVLPGFQNDEIGQVLNREGIAVRTGHHCAQPILRRMGLESTVRPSLAFYNTFEEIDKLVDIVQRIKGGRYNLSR